MHSSMSWGLVGTVLALGCGSVAVTEAPASPPPLEAKRAPSASPGPCTTRSVRIGGTETLEVFVYADDGKLVRARVFADAAELGSDLERASPVRERFIEYDARRRRTKELFVEGSSVHAVYSHYDAKGRLVLTEEDRAGAGTIVERGLRTYDTMGRLVRRTAETIDAQTGTMQIVTERELRYDDKGRLSEERITDHGVQSTVRVVVDDAGRVRARLVDQGRDGTTDQTESYVFTPSGRLASSTTSDRSGTISVATHTYDAAGNLETTEFQDGDGALIRRTTHDYRCWGD